MYFFLDRYLARIFLSTRTFMDLTNLMYFWSRFSISPSLYHLIVQLFKLLVSAAATWAFTTVLLLLSFSVFLRFLPWITIKAILQSQASLLLRSWKLYVPVMKHLLNIFPKCSRNMCKLLRLVCVFVVVVMLCIPLLVMIHIFAQLSNCVITYEINSLSVGCDIETHFLTELLQSCLFVLRYRYFYLFSFHLYLGLWNLLCLTHHYLH